MPKIKLNEKQKKLDIDLWIIMTVSFVSLVIFIVFQKEIYETIKNEELPILFMTNSTFYMKTMRCFENPDNESITATTASIA